MCTDAPDMSGVNAAASANADIARETLDFYRQAYAQQAPVRQAAMDKAAQVADVQTGLLTQQRDIADDRWNYEKGTFRPLEQEMVADARAFDSPERRTAAAAQAAAGVSRQFANAEAIQQRQQASMGVNPNSGRAAALALQRGVQQASVSAAAENDARDRVETQGYARKADAANMGRGLASAQATNSQIASQTGNAAVASANNPVAVAQGGVAMMGQGMGSAVQANSSAGTLFGQAASLEGQYGGSSLAGDLGMLAGGAAALGWKPFAPAAPVSDKGVKSNIKPVADEAALQAIRKTPVSSWIYDTAKGGPDDGAAQHIGPMAQDVQKNMGEAAAPGGKRIDLISLNGIAMKGIQALDKKIDRVAALVAKQGAGRVVRRDEAMA
jgi:hypothetical protein